MPAGWRLDGLQPLRGHPRAAGVVGVRPRTRISLDRRLRLATPRVAGRSARPTRPRARPCVSSAVRAEYTFPGRGGRRRRPARCSATCARAATEPWSLPHEVRTRSLRLEITDVEAPSAAAASRRLDAVAIGEVQVPGLRPPVPRRAGRFETGCGALRVRSARSRRATARASGTLEALDRGAPVRMSGCGPRRALELPAGTGRVDGRRVPRPALPGEPRSPGAGGAPPPASPRHGPLAGRRAETDHARRRA